MPMDSELPRRTVTIKYLFILSNIKIVLNTSNVNRPINTLHSVLEKEAKQNLFLF